MNIAKSPFPAQIESRELARFLWRNSMETIGIIGLGKMGLAMATRLLRQNCPVFGYDRRRESVQIFASLGGMEASSAKEIAKKAEDPDSLAAHLHSERGSDSRGPRYRQWTRPRFSCHRYGKFLAIQHTHAGRPSGGKRCAHD